jgi:hypothetical protein
LLGKLDRQLEPPAEAEAVAADWEPWMEAVAQGLPEPARPEAEDEPDGSEAGPPDPLDPERPFDGSEVWESQDGWWTSFPPPVDFDGTEDGEPGAFGYKRTLSEAERAVVEVDRTTELAAEAARRDLYFGFEGGLEDPQVYSPREAETYETSGADWG